VSVIDVIGTPVAQVLKGIHNGLSTFLEPSSGPAWGLSIVFLTIVVRLLLFPLFVKQIKSQRRMQELAPRIKDLQKVHKGDRETLNVEMMKLYKDNNANPISGCLPLILQLPVFFALFSVIREFKPQAEARFGLTAADLAEGGKAQIFGAPISAAFNSPAELLQTLDGNQGTVRVVATIMLVLMGATTYWTQRQMMARATITDPTQQTVQKVMLYVLPFSFAVFGFSFPVGVLLYWLTTNLWSMGQQAYVIKRMPPPITGPSLEGPKGVPAKGTVDLAKGRPASQARTVKEPVKAEAPARSGAGATHGSRPIGNDGPRRPQRKKKGRPGGRH
jgi:YidC/Oxa1 family membrane protein insertase